MTYSGSDDDALRAAARLLDNGDEGSDLADRLLAIASRLTPDPHRDPPSGGVDGAGYPVAIPHHVAYQQSPNNAYAVVDATGALVIRGIGYYEEDLTIDAAKLRELGLAPAHPVDIEIERAQAARDALLRRARSELARMYGSSLLVESIDASFPRTDTRVHIPYFGSSTRCGQSMDQSPPPLAAPIHESFGAITCLTCLDVEVAAASTESDRHSARLANLITARDALRNARQVGE